MKRLVKDVVVSIRFTQSQAARIRAAAAHAETRFASIVRDAAVAAARAELAEPESGDPNAS